MSDIRWEGFSHEEIYAAVHQGPGRSVSTAAEEAWSATEALILRIDGRIATAMAQSAGGWEGGAAEATRTAISPLGQWALDAANDARITAQAVTAQGEQARELRNAMPEPNAAQLDAEYGRALTDPTYIFHGMDDLQAAEQESTNRAARAVDLMNGYTNNSYENRSHMDYWTLPPQVTVEAGGPAPSPAVGVSAREGAGFAGGGGSWAGAGIETAAAPPATGGGLAPVPNSSVSGGVTGSGGALPVSGGGPGNGGGGAGAGAVPPVGGAPVWPGGGGGVVAAPSAGVVGDRPGTRGSKIRGGRAPGGAGRMATPPGDGSGGPPGRIRPVVPGPTPARAAPSWRDLAPSREPGPSGVWPRSEEERRLPPPVGSRGAGETSSRPPGVERPGPGAEPGARGGAAGRNAVPAHPGLYPPMTAGSVGGGGQEHRRPDYLVDDTDAFADDRWFTPAVIGADDPLPPR